MRKKIEIFVDKKKYIVWDPTVGLYWLSLEEPQQFIDNLFLEFNKEIPRLSDTQLIHLLQELFEIEESIMDKILINKKQTVDKSKINKFHIVVWQFMKFFWNWYEDTMQMPFRNFQKMLKDIKIISWEEEYKEPTQENTPDKQKIKSLLSKFS